jgi:hypothetical protein
VTSARDNVRPILIFRAKAGDELNQRNSGDRSITCDGSASPEGKKNTLTPKEYLSGKDAVPILDFDESTDRHLAQSCPHSPRGGLESVAVF